MKVFKMPQLSDSWWECRRGVPTSSEFNRIITCVKGDLSTSADEYIAELIADVVMQTPAYFSEKGKPANSFAQQQGQDTEPEARKWFEFDAGVNVAEVGFVMDDQFRFGCSPDGLIGLEIADKPGGEFNGHPWYEATAQATLELKCPLLKTQASYLLKGTLPSDYKPQVHGHMAVCGFEYCEFVSYAAGLTPLRVKTERDDYTKKVVAALEGFWQKFEDAKRRLLS